MDLGQVDALVSFIGLASQTAGAALLILLFRLLGNLARRRAYFAVWSNAWVVLTLALAALLARTLPILNGLANYGWWPDLCEFIYQTGKILFFFLLLSGALRYSRGFPARHWYRYGYLLALTYAGVSFASSDGVRGLLLWQVPVAIFCCSYAAWLLLTLPRTRRSLGSNTVGGVLALLVLVWLGYGYVFATAPPPEVFSTSFAGVLSRANAYMDLVLQVVLAYGMVRVLLEDSKHETEAAYIELEIAHQRLLTESLKDSLTGVFNRHAFTEGIGLESARSSFGAIALFDLDNLKQVNDSAGHGAGDALLQHFVAVLRASLRPSDKLYRWGGDEFLLVMPRATADNAMERIAGVMTIAPALQHNGKELVLSASVGCADYVSGAQMETAINKADELMYEHKRQRKRQAVGSPDDPGDIPAN